MTNPSKKEWLLLAGSVVLTLGITLAALRWFAPGLLGIPVDLQAVRVAEKKPPFYDNVFNRDDYRSRDFLLKDPYTRVRAKPLLPESLGLGPHDLLGFRNRAVPNVTDVLILGDSQTYGNNVMLIDNWPNRLKARLDPRIQLYTMATGGWAGIQYLEMFGHGAVFKPRVVIVAFYTGNDPQETLGLAYSNDRWKSLRIDPALDMSDRPPATAFPPSPEDRWKVRFNDGVQTVFSPATRMYSNDRRYATVRTGYKIMEEIANVIAIYAEKSRIKVIYTIIPTKEYVYAGKIRQAKLKPPGLYRELVKNETKNISEFAAALRRLPGALYADVASALQKAALDHQSLYPPNVNGHPVEKGYDVIAEVIAPMVSRLLRLPNPGLAMIQQGENAYNMALIGKNGYWLFRSPKLADANGWRFNLKGKDKSIQWLRPRDVAAFPLLGVIGQVDRKRFGPNSFRH
jgi:hypothetical protein